MAELLRDLAIFGFGALGAIVWAWLTQRSLRRAGISDQSPACPKCSYLVRGWTTPRCPECGTDVRISGVRVRRSAPLRLAVLIAGIFTFSALAKGLNGGIEHLLSRTTRHYEVMCKFGDRQQAVVEIDSHFETWDNLPFRQTSETGVTILAEELNVFVRLVGSDVTPQRLVTAIRPFRALIHEDHEAARFDEMCAALEAMRDSIRDAAPLQAVLARGASFCRTSGSGEFKTPHRRVIMSSTLIAGIVWWALMWFVILRRIKPSIRPPTEDEWRRLNSRDWPEATGA